MSDIEPRSQETMDPEAVAYWYFRLNGYFLIQNFVVHPRTRGSQRTDADLLAVRFPYRAERQYDNASDVMIDDVKSLRLSTNVIDILVVEVKGNGLCRLNGPWTDEKEMNVHRVLAAMGCVPVSEIATAARSLYDTGEYEAHSGVRVRLATVASEINGDLTKTVPAVVQITWAMMLEFMWNRFRIYRNQKKHVQQWDTVGQELKSISAREQSAGFVMEVLTRIDRFNRTRR